MVMFEANDITWWIRSKKDPSWNRDGRSRGMIAVEGMCPEAEEVLKEMERRLVRSPGDLEYGCMKD